MFINKLVVLPSKQPENEEANNVAKVQKETVPHKRNGII